MAKKTKTVNYRRAELVGKNGEPVSDTLEELINRALASDNVPSPVCIEYGIEGQNAQLLLHSRKNKTPYYRSGCLCGWISLCDDVSRVPLVDSVYNEEKDEVFSEHVEPLDSNKKRRKLEQQAHYFAIRGNHVAIMASSGKGVDMLKDFLTILIQDVSGILTTVSVDLVNIPTQNALSMIADKAVRSVSFSSAAYKTRIEQMTDAEIQEIKNREKRTRKQYLRKLYEETEIVKNVLGAIGLPSLLDAYKNSDDLDGLCVAVEFKCKPKKDTSGQKLVQDIARHVGGIEELSPVIQLAGNSRIVKDMLTVKGSLSIDSEGKNLNSQEAMRVLADWLVEQIDYGLV